MTSVPASEPDREPTGVGHESKIGQDSQDSKLAISPVDPVSSNAMSGAEAVVTQLAGHGAKHIFGLCGDTSLPFYDALARLNHGMTHILTRDERSAGYMADGYARVTRKVGICEGPSGGGATYMAPGLVEANESSIPLLSITTDVSTGSAGRFPLTELDQKALFAPLTKWNALASSTDTLATLIRSAFRQATSPRMGATHIALPFDVQKAQIDPQAAWADSRFGAMSALRFAPDADDLEAIYKALTDAERPVVICGGGVGLAGGEAALRDLAEGLDLVIATTISGQGCLPETHPNCLGVVGSNGGVPATRAVVDEADFILFVGCRAGSVTTERWRSPKPGVATAHIDVDPAALQAAYHSRALALGDADLALKALVGLMEEHQGRPSFSGAARIAAAKAEKFTAFQTFAQSQERPIKPERIVASLRQALPDDAIVVADPGTPCPYLSAYFEIRATGKTLFSNRAHGALGYSLAAAAGAQVGQPNRKVVSVMGDGSFGFTVGELETVVRLGLPITFLVLSNAIYGWIKAGQKTGFGQRYFSVDFSRSQHAAIAEAYGVKAWSVDDPRALDSVLAQAIAHDGPSLVDIITQPLSEARAPVSEWVA